MKRLLPTSLCAFILLLLGAGPVRAQDTPPSTSFGVGAISVPGKGPVAEGKGLRFGRSVFHAGVSLEAGWDSNVFFEDSAENPTGSAYLRVPLTFSLGSAMKSGRPFFLYNLSAGLDYVGYLQDLPGAGWQRRHNLGVSVGANLSLQPQGMFTFKLIEQFTRTTEPRLAMEGAARVRDYNNVGFDLQLQPLGLLTLSLGYRFLVDIFEQSGMNYGDVMHHTVFFKGAWRFFPQTSWWLRVETGYTDYFRRDYDPSLLGLPEGGNRDAVPLRITLGVTGRFTPMLTGDLSIGYGGLFFETLYDDARAHDHHDVIAHAGIGLQITPTMDLKFGYRHDFNTSMVADYYKADSAYLRYTASIAQRLMISAVFAWTLANYRAYLLAGAGGNDCEDIGGGVASCKRQDNYLMAGIDVGYHILDWLSVAVGYQLLANVTQFDAIYVPDGGVYYPGFFKHRVFGAVSVFY